jgi:uncharacterized protein with GYD domain
MPRYISLLKFTEKGAQGIKTSTERARKFNEAAKKAGVKIEGQYWSMGRFDGVLILSASQPEQALRCLTELASVGYVKTETLQAFSAEEFDSVVRA